jgi:hypothetical protein
VLKLKTIAMIGILTGLAVLFQIFPALFTHQVVIVTLLSALPIYLITLINPLIGPMAYLVAGIFIFLVSPHESLFFFFANGVLGLSLGTGSYLTKKRVSAARISAVILTITLSLINYRLGILVFGTKIPGPFPVQLAVLLLFSFLYSCLFLYLANILVKKLKKNFSIFHLNS